MKVKHYVIAKSSNKLSEKFIEFNLKAALKTGWLIEHKPNSKKKSK